MENQIQKSEQLATFVKQLGNDFRIYEEIDGCYGHIGATIADGILQANRDYFKILVGLQTAAIDIRLKEFLEESGVIYDGYDEAKEIINGCADILGIDRAKFDHNIWQYIRHQHLLGQAQDGSRCRRRVSRTCRIRTSLPATS